MEGSEWSGLWWKTASSSEEKHLHNSDRACVLLYGSVIGTDAYSDEESTAVQNESYQAEDTDVDL